MSDTALHNTLRAYRRFADTCDVGGPDWLRAAVGQLGQDLARAPNLDSDRCTEIVRLRSRIAHLEQTARVRTADCEAWGVTAEAIEAAARAAGFKPHDTSLWAYEAGAAKSLVSISPFRISKRPGESIAIIARVRGCTAWVILRELGTEPAS